MSIPTGGIAALLVVASIALSSCGSDDATVTTTTVITPSTAARTTTQPAQTTTSASTTTQPAQTTTSAPRTTPRPAQTTASAAAPPKPDSTCPRVTLGVRDGDIAETFGRIDRMRKVDCATAAVVVGQWGGQRIGSGKALLPVGWKCRGRTCSNGGRSVTFSVEFPTDDGA